MPLYNTKLNYYGKPKRKATKNRKQWLLKLSSPPYQKKKKNLSSPLYYLFIYFVKLLFIYLLIHSILYFSIQPQRGPDLTKSQTFAWSPRKLMHCVGRRWNTNYRQICSTKILYVLELKLLLIFTLTHHLHHFDIFS